MKDHYAYLVTGRNDLEENLVYQSAGVERIIPKLCEGDKLRLQREGKSYPQIFVQVLENHGEFVVVEDENNNHYKLWGRWYPENSRATAQAWLRTDTNTSAGRVTSLTILNLT